MTDEKQNKTLIDYGTSMKPKLNRRRFGGHPEIKPIGCRAIRINPTTAQPSKKPCHC